MLCIMHQGQPAPPPPYSMPMIYCSYVSHKKINNKTPVILVTDLIKMESFLRLPKSIYNLSEDECSFDFLDLTIYQ